MRKIILFILSFSLSFWFFTKDTFAEIYDYDISKYQFKPVASDKLLNWVPTDIEKFIYKNPIRKNWAVIWTWSITTSAVNYLTHYDFDKLDLDGNFTKATNFESMMPFFAIVNPKYLDSDAKIGIPIVEPSGNDVFLLCILLLIRMNIKILVYLFRQNPEV